VTPVLGEVRLTLRIVRERVATVSVRHRRSRAPEQCLAREGNDIADVSVSPRIIETEKQAARQADNVSRLARRRAFLDVPLHFLIIITPSPLALRVRHHVTSTA